MKYVIGCLLGVFLIFTDCYAFRCGDNLVSSGDSVVSLNARCGRPSWRSSTIQQFGNTWERVEKWFYNCGKDDFIYVLTIKGDRIISDTSLERGAGTSQCKGRK